MPSYCGARVELLREVDVEVDEAVVPGRRRPEVDHAEGARRAGPWAASACAAGGPARAGRPGGAACEASVAVLGLQWLHRAF